MRFNTTSKTQRCLFSTISKILKIKWNSTKQKQIDTLTWNGSPPLLIKTFILVASWIRLLTLIDSGVNDPDSMYSSSSVSQVWKNIDRNIFQKYLMQAKVVLCCMLVLGDHFVCFCFNILLLCRMFLVK